MKSKGKNPIGEKVLLSWVIRRLVNRATDLETMALGHPPDSATGLVIRVEASSLRMAARTFSLDVLTEWDLGEAHGEPLPF